MTIRYSLLGAACAALALAGCKTTGAASDLEGPQVVKPDKAPKAGAKSEGKPGDKKGEENGPTENIPQVATRAKLQFDDAIKSLDTCRKKGDCDWGLLEKKFVGAGDLDEHFGEAYFNAGVMAERKGDFDAARDHYKTAINKRPTLYQAAENLAVIEQNKGNEQGAVDTYQGILEKYPENGSARARLAEIYRRRGEHDRAIELSREALFREPKTLTAYKVMMSSYYEQRQLSLAKLVALRALKLDEHDPEIYYTLGLISLAEKEPAKARVQFKTAAEKRADYLPAHLQLAKMAMDTSDYSGAEQSIRKILAVDGKNAEAHLNLGIAYKGMGQYDKAMAEYDTALKLKSELVSATLNKAIILNIKKEPTKAIELAKAYEAQPGADPLKAEQVINDANAIIATRQQEEKDKLAAECMEKGMAKSTKVQERFEKLFQELSLKHTQCLAKAKKKPDQKACDDAANGEDQKLKAQYEAENLAINNEAKKCQGLPVDEPPPGTKDAEAGSSTASKDDDVLSPENKEKFKDDPPGPGGTKVAKPEEPKKEEPKKKPEPAKGATEPAKGTSKETAKGGDPDEPDL
jgi:tetratricopeptide (TPR) repeat protein